LTWIKCYNSTVKNWKGKQNKVTKDMCNKIVQAINASKKNNNISLQNTDNSVETEGPGVGANNRQYCQ